MSIKSFVRCVIDFEYRMRRIADLKESMNPSVLVEKKSKTLAQARNYTC